MDALDAGASEVSSSQANRADKVIEAIERRRSVGEIRYAYVSLESSFSVANEISAPSLPINADAAEPCSNCARKTPAQTIGGQIRGARLAAGLTQKQLVAHAGITQTVLSRIESGTGNPTLGLLEDIAAALGSSLEVTLAGAPQNCPESQEGKVAISANNTQGIKSDYF